MLLGVDVSHHQPPHEIDWDAFAREGVKFAFVRATYGVTPDDTFLEHVGNARRAGILAGAYHFLRFKQSQPADAQADAFLEALEPLMPHVTPMLPPVLDLEDNRFDDQIVTAADRRAFVGMANTWLQAVERRLTRLAAIYTRASFFDGTLDKPAGFGVRPLWVAHYTTRPSPNLPEAWTRYHFWQFAESGRLDGYTGNLDLNRFDGAENELGALTTLDTVDDGGRTDTEGETRMEPLGEVGQAVRRVAATGLNLRSAPKVTASTFMVTLPLAHRVEVLASGIDGKWSQVRTFVNNAEITGFVSESYLRDTGNDSVEALVDSAVSQWHRFSKGQGQEHVAPYFTFVGEMWQELGLDFDGRDREQFWSAAAISYFVNHAGTGYAGFKRDIRHSTYINDAIVKREAGADAPFWGFRLDEQQPEVGDIVCQWRQSRITYDDARVRDKFASHTDVIVGIHHGVAVTLGGNVRQSVATKEYRLDNGGFLVPENNLFALMKNRTS